MIDETSDLSLTLDKVALQALRVVDSGNDDCVGYVALVDHDRMQFVACTSWPHQERLEEQFGVVALDDPRIGVVGQAARDGSTRIDHTSLIDPAFQSVLAVPIRHAGETLGVIAIEATTANAFDDDAVRHVELIGTTTAVTIAHHPEWQVQKQPGGETTRKAYLRKLVVDLKIQSIFAAINRLFSEFTDLTASDTPLLTFERTLARLLAPICDELGAQFAFILKDMGHKVGFQVYDLYATFDVPPSDEVYTFDDGEWQALGEGKGVLVTNILSFSRRSRSRLPFTAWYTTSDVQATTEIGIIRVGGNLNDARYLLVLGQETGSARVSFSMEEDTFDLIALRLYEIYNIALHMQAQVQYDRDRQQFIQDVMHQLNSSLGAIKADVENLVDGVIPETEFPEAFDRLYALASMFQGYTKTFVLAANNRSILEVYRSAFSPFSARDVLLLLEEHAAYFQGKALNAGIDGPYIDAESFAEFPPLLIHKDLFELVIFNLYDNAIKYSWENVQAPVRVTGKVDGVRAEIHITNHGILLPDDELETVFNRFKRSDAAINYVGVGTGIGLYLCREIMQHHKGEVFALPSQPSKVIDGAYQVTFVIRMTRHER
jgi:signal transduction histidine kinase